MRYCNVPSQTQTYYFMQQVEKQKNQFTLNMSSKIIQRHFSRTH